MIFYLFVLYYMIETIYIVIKINYRLFWNAFIYNFLPIFFILSTVMSNLFLHF